MSARTRLMTYRATTGFAATALALDGAWDLLRARPHRGGSRASPLSRVLRHDSRQMDGARRGGDRRAGPVAREGVGVRRDVLHIDGRGTVPRGVGRSGREDSRAARAALRLSRRGRCDQRARRRFRYLLDVLSVCERTGTSRPLTSSSNSCRSLTYDSAPVLRTVVTLRRMTRSGSLSNAGLRSSVSSTV
jgi:hypothetical protein